MQIQCRSILHVETICYYNVGVVHNSDLWLVFSVKMQQFSIYSWLQNQCIMANTNLLTYMHWEERVSLSLKFTFQ